MRYSAYNELNWEGIISIKIGTCLRVLIWVCGDSWYVFTSVDLGLW